MLWRLGIRDQAPGDDVADQRHGGRAVAHFEGGRKAPGALQKAAPDAKVFPTGTAAAEPTLGVTKKGHVFYVGLTEDGTSNALYQWPVMRSTDEGKSWEEVSPFVGPERRHTWGLDPFIYVDKDTDRVFTADISLVAGCSAYVSFSDDEGKTWTTSKVCGLTDHQNLFTGPPATSTTIGYPNVAYYCAADGGALAGYSTMTSCVKSIDGGITWIRTGEPAFRNDMSQQGEHVMGLPGHCAGLTGHGFVDEKGTVYLPRGWCGQPYLAISKDEGATWDRVQVATNGMPYGQQLEEHEAGVAVDEAGTIYYTWTGRDRRPYLALSRNGGKSFSKPMMVGPPGIKEASLPTIDVGDNGKIAIAYVGSTNAPGGRSPDGAGPEYDKVTWNGYITISDNVLSRRPVFYTGSVNRPSDPLVRGECPILRCQQVYDFIDVVIGPDGTPWAALVDGCPRDEKVCRAGWGLGIVGRLVGGPRLK